MTLVSGKVWLVEKFARGHPQKWCQMRVGWVFSTIFNQYVVISRKRCILDTKLLWGGNRKPYEGYGMVSLSMTLSDPWPEFQGHGSFKRRISPKRCILQTQLLYKTLIGNHMQAIDRQASYTAYNPTALTQTMQTFRKRRAGLSATAGLSCSSLVCHQMINRGHCIMCVYCRP